ncbi:glycosyltransferase [Hydrotalea sp.]|uniref:glycosyltransferase n=1 Tax=Hydrotalea sp. TaxID=2881279 RepID=UPI003D0971E3
MQVLWLASWYPDAFEPYNGDFIQRNARSVAELMPITVIHVLQAGSNIHSKYKFEINKQHQLEEWIVYFSFKPTPIKKLNTLLYQRAYVQCYKKVLKKYLSTYGKPAIVHVHAPFRAGMVARKWCRKMHLPYIVSEHASMYAETAIDGYFEKPFWFKNALLKIMQQAAIVTNVSFTVANAIQKIFNLSTVTVVPNLVNTQYFQFKAEPQPNKFTFLHVSSLLPQKNVNGILKAFALLKNEFQQWQLVIVGPKSSVIEAEIEQLELTTYVHLTDTVPYEKVATYMQQANALVLFSWQENAPCVIFEALCCGLPVITSSAGGAADFINENNGIIVPPGDEMALLNAYRHILQEYSKFNRFAIANSAGRKFAQSVIASQIVALYKPFLG